MASTTTSNLILINRNNNFRAFVFSVCSDSDGQHSFGLLLAVVEMLPLRPLANVDFLFCVHLLSTRKCCAAIFYCRRPRSSTPEESRIRRCPLSYNIRRMKVTAAKSQTNLQPSKNAIPKFNLDLCPNALTRKINEINTFRRFVVFAVVCVLLRARMV